MSDIKHVSANLKVHVTGDFFDPDTTEETLRYAVEQCLEDSFDDVDVRVENDTNAQGKWISVKDGLPEDGKHVLVICEIRPIGRASRKYVCEAFYTRKFSISDVSFEDDIAYDYNEEEDEYYLKEGWYECIHNWDEYSSIVIGDFVTHWQNLPEPPEEIGNGNMDV